MKITLYLVNNDPNGLREARIDQWSGRAVCIPRQSLGEALKGREELDGPCLYFLVTPQPHGTKLRVYVGEADGFSHRVRNHDVKREGWQTVVAFYSADGSLTKTGIQYLESRSIERLAGGGWCELENGNAPGLPTIPPEDREGLELFAGHVAALMPILGYDIFASAPAEAARETEDDVRTPEVLESDVAAQPRIDTLVCPAKEEGFIRAFLGERAWWAVRIGEQSRARIRYIAIYQVAPISAITYYGEVASIEPFKDTGKFRLILKGEPIKLDHPIGIGKNRHLKPQGPKYTNLEAIKNATTLNDLFGAPQVQ